MFKCLKRGKKSIKPYNNSGSNCIVTLSGRFKNGYLKEFFGFDDSVEITACRKITGWVTAGDQDLLDCFIPEKPNISLIFAACSIQRYSNDRPIHPLNAPDWAIFPNKSV